MNIANATETSSEPGPLSQLVLKFAEMIEAGATGRGEAMDWEPFKAIVATDSFTRVGAYQEVMDWKGYTDFVSEWAGQTEFESTIFRISEVGNVVFKQIEERHRRGDEFIRKNVLAVYEFDEDTKLRHLDIYEQAGDSGRWIIESANAHNMQAPGDLKPPV